MDKIKNFTSGTFIWVVERNENNTAVNFNCYTFIALVEGTVVAGPWCNNNDALKHILDWSVDATKRRVLTGLVAFPVDDCFASREDAATAYFAEKKSI